MILKGDSEDVSILWDKHVTWFTVTETVYKNGEIKVTGWEAEVED